MWDVSDVWTGRGCAAVDQAVAISRSDFTSQIKPDFGGRFRMASCSRSSAASREPWTFGLNGNDVGRDDGQNQLMAFHGSLLPLCVP